jgi:hypothetical protein
VDGHIHVDEPENREDLAIETIVQQSKQRLLLLVRGNNKGRSAKTYVSIEKPKKLNHL